MPSLRAFLMLRGGDGKWSVSVHQDLESLTEAWKSRPELESATGVVHIGFDRPPSREFEALANSQPGRVLLTASARYALPTGFEASNSPIGQVGALPVFIGTRGWGYLLDVVEQTPTYPRLNPRCAPQGWVRNFLQARPDAVSAFEAAEIYDNGSYFDREGMLIPEIRMAAGLHRFESLIAADRGDPCAFARAAPPWLLERPFSTIDLTVRVSNVFATLGVQKVADLGRHTLSGLLGAPNFGRKSVSDLMFSLNKALREGPFSLDERIGQASQVSLLESVRRSLSKFPDRDGEIVRRRMGLDGPAETLQQIADDYGITRERVRQVESKIVNRLIGEELWDDLLSDKLSVLLRGREFPLPLLGVEAADPWFGGIAQFPGALRYILGNICAGHAGIVSIYGVDYLSFLDQSRWEAMLSEARRILEGGATQRWSEQHCRSLIHGLLPTAAQEFRALLWDKASRYCHFVDGESGARYLNSYGRGAEHVVAAVLEAAERPLHFSEIAPLASRRAGREIDLRRAHNAAATVGLLFDRGTYGVERHLPVDNAALEQLAEAAEELVTEGAVGRQWHAAEILATLTEQGVIEGTQVTKYIVNIALQRSGGLERLGRMVWKQRQASDDEVARIDLRQAIITLLQQAGRPLRAKEIRQRLLAVRGLNEHFQIMLSDPLIRVDVALWGLNDRDVSVKRPEQPRLLDRLADALSDRGFALHASEIHSAGLAPPDLSAEALFSLALSDSKFRVSPAQYLYLTEWGDPRRESVSEAVAAIVHEAVAPMSLSEIAAKVEARIHRPCERNTISGCLRALEAHFDHKTSQWSRGVPLGLDLADDDDVAATAQSEMV